MSAALEAPLLPAPSGLGQDFGVLPYLGSDMQAHRNALGLQVEQLILLQRTGVNRQLMREDDELAVPPILVEELLDMAEFVEEETDTLLADATADSGCGGKVSLKAVQDQDEFNGTYPQERTLRHEIPFPLTLQHVAVGRAGAELTRRGCDVEVYRGDRRADLTVRRLAAGLWKNETAELLGVEKKHYYKLERGQSAPPAGLLAELQAVDDFITGAAAELTVTEVEGVSVVWVLADQDEFERTYPKARTLRDGEPYPQRVLRVAASRRAVPLFVAGADVRVRIAGAARRNSL